MQSGPNWSQKLRAEIAKAVIGQDAAVERMLVALLANGHVLLEGMPGLAKTLLIKSLGTALGVRGADVEERFVRGTGPGGQKIKMFKSIPTVSLPPSDFQ